ncbi:MAG: phage tail family protein [Alicyclobacillus sp.]|nr:phage tail family protein [Alicyclobacillus sp.]
MKTFSYNGISCDTMGLKYLTHTRVILPTLARQIQVVPGRDGEVYFGSQVGALQFQVNVSLMKDTLVDLNTQLDEIAAWLRPGSDPLPLVLPDRPNQTYYAILDGDSDVSVLATMGSATLTFICPDPHGYGAETTQTLTPGSSNLVENPGSSDAYPIVDVTLSAPTTFLSVITPDKYVLLGNPDSVEQTPINPKAPIITDECTDISVWQTGSVTDYGSTIQGSFDTDGNAFYVKDFGTATSGWAGPALVRSVPTPFHDFKLHVLVDWDTTNDIEAMGRIDVFCLDANGAVLAKVNIIDAWTKSKLTEIYGRVGAKTASNTVLPLQTFGKKQGGLNKYYGSLAITRQGQNWTFYTARRTGPTDSPGVYTDYVKATWYDKNKEFDNNIAQVEIHATRYKSYKTPAKMHISHVFLYQLTNADVSRNQVPYIGNAGDTVRIDCGRSAVYVNGEPRMDLVDPSSDFPGLVLVPGSTPVDVEPPDSISSATITFQPRY